MKLYKLYFLYDSSMFGKSGLLIALVFLFAMQLLASRDSFGFVFLAVCGFTPLALIEVFTSWKYQDSKQTEYLFSLPASRIHVVMSGFLLVLVTTVALVFFCIFIDLSGIPDRVHQYLAQLLSTNFYNAALDRNKDILFGVDKLPVYLLLTWTASCFGWLPVLLVGPGLRRIMLKILTWSLGPLLGWVGAIYFASQGNISTWMLSGVAAIASIVFILGILRFKNVQLTY